MLEKSSPPYLFGDLLALARQSWIRQMADRLEQRGHRDYRRSDAAVLRLLGRGPLTVGGLGAALGISRQAARKLAGALERRGYVRIEADPDDRRRTSIILSPAGGEYAGAIAAVVEELNRELAARVDPDELRAVDAVLRAALDGAASRRAAVLVRSPGEPAGRASRLAGPNG